MSSGRKAAHLSTVGGKSPRQRTWEALRANPEGVTAYTLARASGVDDSAVLVYLRCLIAGGYVERKGRTYNTAVYPLLRDVGAEAPRLNRDGTPNTRGLGSESMWRALRIVPDIDAPELAEIASAGDMKVGLRAAVSYLDWLRRAGYVVVVSPGQPGAYARYRLVPGKHTGPRPPMIQKVGQVFDPNLGQVVYRAQPETEL